MEHSNIPFTSRKRRQPFNYQLSNCIKSQGFVISRGKVASHYAWHIISPYSNLPLETLPTHRKTMENPSDIDIKTVIYQPAKSQQRTRPSRQYICPEPLWRQKPKWAATPTPGLILRERRPTFWKSKLSACLTAWTGSCAPEPPLCESTNTSKDHGLGLLKTWSEISSFHGWTFPVQVQPLSTRIRTDHPFGDSQNLGISNGPSGEDQKSGTWHNVASISLALPTKTPILSKKVKSCWWFE